MQQTSRFHLFLWLGKIYIKTSPPFFAWQIFSSIYQGLSPIAQAYLAANFITSVTKIILNHASSGQAVKWIVLIGILYVISSVVSEFDTLIRNRFTTIVQIKMHGLFIDKMYSLSQEQFDDEEFSARVSKAREALYTMYSFFADIFWLISSVFRFVGSLVAVFITAYIVGILIILALVPVMIVDYAFNKIRHKDQLATDKYVRMAYRTRYILEDPAQMPEVRVLSAYKSLFHVWKSNTEKVLDRDSATDTRALKWRTLSDVIDNTAIVLANLWFLHLAIMGKIGLSRFLFLRGLLLETTSSGANIVTTLERLHKSVIEFENVRIVLQTEPIIKNGKMPVTKDSLRIEFRDVSFKYPHSDGYVLQNISFTIEPDSKIALVGENGAGKSTIIRLLLRQYLPSEGDILVNGTPIQDLNTEQYYAAISILFQDFNTFSHLTVRENISIGSNQGSIGDKEIHKAAELAEASNFIGKLKHGYDQRLSSNFDDGADLSGGQKQRLGIARAMLRRSALLILDEPTSAIDAKGEYKIFSNIYKAHEGKATLIVSHRFSTVRKADTIIVLSEGKMVQKGSHSELTKKDGLYKQMFDLQAEGYR